MISYSDVKQMQNDIMANAKQLVDYIRQLEDDNSYLRNQLFNSKKVVIDMENGKVEFLNVDTDQEREKAFDMLDNTLHSETYEDLSAKVDELENRILELENYKEDLENEVYSLRHVSEYVGFSSYEPL